jgi:hypothetical protein
VSSPRSQRTWITPPARAERGVAMASEASSDAQPPDATAPERTAAELGSILAEQVRTAIETAERSAAELRREALEHAAADRDDVDRSASLVLGRIDAIEAQVARLLESLREEVARIRDLADEEEQSATPADPPSAPEHPDPRGNGSTPAAPRRHRRLFARRRALPQCAVCGRTALDGEPGLEQWWRTRRLSLCPQCQAGGWQVPDGASVPHRAPRGREPD